jgi:hypothetical protein
MLCQSVIPFYPFDNFINATDTVSARDLDTYEATIAVPYTPRVLDLPIVGMAASVLEVSSIINWVARVPPLCHIAVFDYRGRWLGLGVRRRRRIRAGIGIG